MGKYLGEHTKWVIGDKIWWEKEVMPQISNGKIAYVCDDAFLDYYFNAFLHKYPKLYRSKQDLVAMPFVIPLGIKNQQLNRLFSKL